MLPSYYKSFYEVPEQTYPTDVDLANQMLDDAGWESNGDEPRTKGDQELSFDLYVRSESQSDTQAAKLIAEMAAEIGVEFNVQVVSVGKLTELTIQKLDGLPAPDFDTFIWGWGGDPYDPSSLLGLFTTGEIGAASDSFYSNPEYDRLFDRQAAEFDTEARKELIQKMVAIIKRTCPTSSSPRIRTCRPTARTRSRSRAGLPGRRHGRHHLRGGLLRGHPRPGACRRRGPHDDDAGVAARSSPSLRRSW